MPRPFFPDPLFAWAFYLVLVSLLTVASYSDVRRLKIPNRLTLVALVLGILFNIGRGAWMGATGVEAYLLGAQGPWVGAVDGLLFALAGFATGFVLLFIVWILGWCGGGDVKLLGALGAWVGPTLVIFVLAGSALVFLVIAVFQLGWRFARRGTFRTIQKMRVDSSNRRSPKGPQQSLTAYAVPLAVSTALILLWVFRTDLHLMESPAAANRAPIQARD